MQQESSVSGSLQYIVKKSKMDGHKSVITKDELVKKQKKTVFRKGK